MKQWVNYEYIKKLAREFRDCYELTSDTVSRSSLRKVCSQEGITIDNWPYKLRKVRGAYLLIDDDPYVLINAQIKPKEPRIFILAHELKHHLVDQEIARKSRIGREAGSWSEGSSIEISAEIFAAELIYPEAEFYSLAKNMGLIENGCSVKDVVLFKKECPAPISYTFIRKRLEWFRILEKGEFKGFRFQNLEDQMFGIPPYRRLRSGRS